MQIYKMRTDMEFLKLLLSVELILAKITAFHISDNSENFVNNATIYRLPNNTIPVHYTIRLTLYIEEGNFTFYGESNINIEIHYATPNISLHSLDLEINEMATTLTNNDGTIYYPMQHAYDNETHILTLNFDNVLSPGLYTLNMKFVGYISESKRGFMRTFYTDQEGKKTWLAVTLLQPFGARRVFPCWDEPALKATFDISVKHHQKYRALSNMPIRDLYIGHSMMWTLFNTTPIMSTYLVAIVVSDFVRSGNANETINICCRSSKMSQTKFAQDVAEKVVQLLIQYTNISEKVPKMDHVAVPDYQVYGMENWGLIIYDETAIFYDNNTDPTFQRMRIASFIAHELVHQWFGNLVTPSWWSDLWLSEGFATFFEAYFLNKIFEDWRRMDFLVVEQLHKSLAQDAGSEMGAVKLDAENILKYESAYSVALYEKAPAILRMLQHTISDDVFRKGVITYLTTHQFNSTTSDDLWSAMQTALDESDIPHKGYNIKEVMDTWINQKHYPLVNVTRNYETGEVIISQERFSPPENDTDRVKWWIPVTFATQSNPDFSNTLPSHWLRPQDQNISFESNPNDWIIVNVQQTGHYRVNYDSTNWQKIAHYLNSEEYTKIHVLNRAQIIYDAFALAMRNQLDAFIFDDLINYLSRETDYIAWYPMFRILAQLEETFAMPQINRSTIHDAFGFAISKQLDAFIFENLINHHMSQRTEHVSQDPMFRILGQLRESFVMPQTERFKSHIAKMFDGLLETIGYEEVPEEDDIAKLRRVNATMWACLVGNSECKRVATAKLDYHLAHADTHKLLPWWQEWTYCIGLMAANRSIWERTMDLFVQERNKNLLQFLACSEDSDIIINYLNIITSHNVTLQYKERNFAFNSIVIKHARNSMVLNYILENFETVIPNSMSTVTVLKHIIFNVYSKEQLDKIKEFMTRNLREEPEVSTVIQSAIENRLVDLENLVHKFGFLRKESYA